jgi:hypothetical protein
LKPNCNVPDSASSSRTDTGKRSCLDLYKVALRRELKGIDQLPQLTWSSYTLNHALRATAQLADRRGTPDSRFVPLVQHRYRRDFVSRGA